jgi:hypothetical protein
MMSDDIFFACNCELSSQLCVTFSRARNSSMKVKYKGYNVAYNYSTPYRTEGGNYLTSIAVRRTLTLEGFKYALEI